jgi:hypothetical protein
MMNLPDFCRQIRGDYPDAKSAVVVLVANLNDDGAKTWHIEVELTPGDIGGVYDTGLEVPTPEPDTEGANAVEAAEQVVFVEDYLRSLGFEVEEDWEEDDAGDPAEAR